MGFRLGDEIILTEDQRRGPDKFRAGTIGIIVEGNGLIEPDNYWVDFPNLPLRGGRLDGGWIAPAKMRPVELLEKLSGGCTDTNLSPAEQAQEMKWLRKQVAAARREKRKQRIKDKSKEQKRKDRVTK